MKLFCMAVYKARTYSTMTLNKTRTCLTLAYFNRNLYRIQIILIGRCTRRGLQWFGLAFFKTQTHLPWPYTRKYLFGPILYDLTWPFTERGVYDTALYMYTKQTNFTYVIFGVEGRPHWPSGLAHCETSNTLRLLQLVSHTLQSFKIIRPSA